jgi:Cu-Zn family superoxide dismutase
MKQPPKASLLHGREHAKPSLPRRREPKFASRQRIAPACAITTIIFCLAAAPNWLAAHLAYDRHAILCGELWRLWTAHLVHFSWQHAVSDALVLFAATTLVQRLAGARLAWTALAIGAPGIALGLLWAAPHMTEYRGASGLALMMCVLYGALLWRTAPRLRWLLAALACGLFAKTTAEAFGFSPGLAGLPYGVAVAWQAHALGALYAAALLAWTGNPLTCEDGVNTYKKLHWSLNHSYQGETMNKSWMSAAVLWSACAVAGAAPAESRATMNVLTDAGVGAPAGTVTIAETPYGVVFTPSLAGLPPGLHGFHVHEVGNCDAAQKDGKPVAGLAAGAHYDPAASKHHGMPWGDGHLGDLPALYVDTAGAATNPVLAPRLKLADVKGRALMVHAGGDNHADHPAALGGGGARLVCGVIR